MLQVINASPGDLAPVFDAMLEKATALRRRFRLAVRPTMANVFRAVATRGLLATNAEAMARTPYRRPCDRPERVAARRTVLIHIADIEAVPSIPTIRPFHGFVSSSAASDRARGSVAQRRRCTRLHHGLPPGAGHSPTSRSPYWRTSPPRR